MRAISLSAIITVAVVLTMSGAATGSHSPGATPLDDLGSGLYLNAYQGGLYEGGANLAPVDHDAAGAAKAAAITPLDAAGGATSGGKVVLLSVGMSNTTQEFCSASSALPCDSWTFMGLSAADPAVNHTNLVIVNGAAGGQTASTWDASTDANYDRVRDTRLTPAGVTEAQVQAAWVKVANAGPTASLPAANADAYTLETLTGNVVRAMKSRYPNLQMIFLSSRIYAGYATTTLNPEPYAYESGLAMKWLIQAQVDQVRNGGVIVDPRGGNLAYTSGVAPWLGWGAYLWADGLVPRSDGLTWVASDFAADGTHPSTSGRGKVGDMLFDFFSTSRYTRCWFLADSDGDGVADVCETAVDSDGDSVLDDADNCPAWPNAGQALPSWSVPVGDSDCDGFPATVTAGARGRESFIGTDATDQCADDAVINNERGPTFGEPVSPWPPDVNDNRQANLSDIVAIGPWFNQVGPNPPNLLYNTRFDLNASGGVNLSDIVAIGPFFNKSCTS